MAVYTYRYSQEYGTICLSRIEGLRREYVDELHLVGEVAKELYTRITNICPDYELRRVIAQQNQEVRMIIEQYWEQYFGNDDEQ